MRPTQTLTGAKARKAIYQGVNAIYDTVRRTLGPEGKNSLLYGTFGREPRITNDVYTVAECQEPKNPFVNLVAHIFRDSCKKTNEIVGDGTTTTAIIGGKLYNDIYGLLSDNKTVIGENTGKIGQVALKNKILASADTVKAEVK